MLISARPGGRGVEELRLGDGDRAMLVAAKRDADPAGLLPRLGLPAGRPVVALLGGGAPVPDDPLSPVARLPGAALLEAAEVAGAAVVDGGAAAGAAAEVGAAAAETDRPVPLVGVVAGEGDPALEPHHGHFVRVGDADEAATARLLAGVAAALAGGAPVVAVLAGGGTGTLAELLEAVRRRWPVLVLERSGGTADDVVRWWHTQRNRPRRLGRPAALGRRRAAEAPPVVDAALATIVARGDLRFVDGEQPGELARLLAWELQDGPVLKLAWERCARYRAAAGAYQGEDRERALVERLGAIDAELLRTEAAAASLPPWTGPLPPPGSGDQRTRGAAAGRADDGLSPLDPDRYLQVRLAAKLDADRGAAAAIERRLRRLQLLTLAAGAAGTLLAAAGFELWVALTTVAGTATVAFLAHLRADTALLACNRAAALLESARARWLADPAPAGFAALVDAAESAPDGELAPWLPAPGPS